MIKLRLLTKDELIARGYKFDKAGILRRDTNLKIYPPMQCYLGDVITVSDTIFNNRYIDYKGYTWDNCVFRLLIDIPFKEYLIKAKRVL